LIDRCVSKSPKPQHLRSTISFGDEERSARMPRQVHIGKPGIDPLHDSRTRFPALALVGITGRTAMLYRTVIGGVVLAATLSIGGVGAQAQDFSKYPDWSGAWARFVVRGVGGQPSFDQTKPWGLGQQAPLTPEYQKVLEDSIADQAQGGQGNFFDHARCISGGMPMMTTAFIPMEFVITPRTTYILIGEQSPFRRIYTDGRDWRDDIEPSYAGYSIGRWIDEAGNGRYDVLEVETRGPFKGPRVYDPAGLPLHFDNQSIFKERIYRDQDNRDMLHDQVTVIDHALTRPWTVDKRYLRSTDELRPKWPEYNCNATTQFVAIGKDMYYQSADGYLMPMKKNQEPPDLRYFHQPKK